MATMASSNGGRTTGSTNKKKDGKLVDTMRGACPPHRHKDLDSLIKQLNGDEEKIQAKIQEWWEEPQEEEEKWEDVNKKDARAKAQKAPFVSRGVGSGRAPGRGGRSNRGAGGGKDLARAPREGRGGRDGVERRPGGRGRGQRSHEREQINREPRSEDAPLPEEDKDASPDEPVAVAIPAPVPAPAPVPKPTWSVRASAASTAGNVWASKGSAHLIQAEKPKPVPPPAPLPPPPSQVEQPTPVATPLQPSLPSETTIETLLPAQPAPSVPAWTSPAKTPKSVVEIPPSPVVSQPQLTPAPTASAVEEAIITEPPPDIPVTSAPKALVKAPAVSLPTNVLSLGHWETGADDSHNLDFGFGSFGTDSDVGIVETTTASESATGLPSNASSAAQNSAPPALSPARPPPGLSISGMPPIPANAVLVHELENSLENTSLNPHPDHGMHEVSDRSIPNALPQTNASAIMSSQQHQPAGAPVLPQQNYGQYSMAGVYGYGSAGNGFMGGVHTPVLAGGVIPQKPQQPPSAGSISGQQQQQQLGSGVGISLAQPQHSGLYGSTGASSGGSSQVASDTDTSAATAPIPPTMPGGVPYNQVYYSQQPFHHMGQPQGGIGYNYGYGAAQFGGAGGFGYQQVMGQSGAYHAGAPPYDDQTHTTAGAHHAGSAGGYQKTTGYRGRSSHHSGNQYQNQYNPPSGYGAQPPYGMGYGVDHFNQRGVSYGPQGAMDPYMQQQQQQQQGNAGAYPSSGMHRGSFPDEEQYKKKGGRNNNNGSNLQQFPPQQHNPNATPAHLAGQQQQQQQQHSFGLPQSGAAQSADTGSSTGGWSNHHGGSGWGGVPSWQGS